MKLKLILMGFVYCSCIYANSWNYQLKNNLSYFSSNDIQILKAGFSATIIVDGHLMTVKPEGNPTLTVDNVETPMGVSLQKRYKWHCKEHYELIWDISKIGNSIYSIRAEFVNHSSKSVFLKNFLMLETPANNMTVTGKAADWMLASTDVEVRRWGTLEQYIPSEKELASQNAYSRKYFSSRGMADRASDPAWRCYLSDATLYHKGDGKGMTFAAVDTVSNVYFNFKVQGTQMKLEAESDMSEVLVDPHETRTSDEILLISRPWAEAQMLKNEWIKTVTHAELKKKPIFGWCSWYTMGLKVSPNGINNMISFCHENMNKLPFEIIQIDDGWQVLRGIWTENNKFYNQLEPISKNIQKLGIRPGLWLSPVRSDQIIGVDGDNEQVYPRDWFVKEYDGTQLGSKLDPTNPNVAEHIKQSLQRWLKKGYTYFKLDFSQIGYGTKRLYDPKYTSFQAQRKLFKLYREAIGAESYLLACGISDQRYLSPYVDADRIGTDTGIGKGFAHEPMATDNQPADIHGFWYPILSMVNKCYENGVLANGDPDVTYTRQWGKTSLAQLHTFHSFVGIYAGSATTSVQFSKPEYNTANDMRMMEILYPISKEKGHSFTGGWDMCGSEFGYQVNRPFGKWTNVIVWNPMHKQAKDLSIKETPTPGRNFHVWSFWDETYKGIKDKNYLLKNIGPYECGLLRLTALSSRPVIIGSNLHIGMGTVEVKNVSFKDGLMCIELDPNAGARNGRIYIYSKDKLSMPPSDHSNMALIKKDNHVYMLILTDRERTKPERIEIIMGKGEAVSYNQFENTPIGKELIKKSSFTNIR
jgi:alpha-galactosidase